MNPVAPGLRAWWIAIALLAFAGQAQAQAQRPPDAGTLLRQQPAPPTAVPAPAPIPGPELPAPDAVLKGPRFVVKGFRFTGAVLIPEAELQQWVAPYLDQNITFGVLQVLAQQLTGYYLEKGYLARVLVPEQEVKDGVVLFRVIEGVRGSLSIDNEGQRVDGERVARFIDRRLGEGDVFSVARLNEAIAILNDQPGVQASTSLKPGTREGEVAVVASARDKPLWSGGANINDHGTSASGKYQVSGGLNLNNPTGNFDLASGLFNASEGNTYARGEYSLAVGDRGLRLGANASHLDYRIIQDNLRALDLNGSASTYGFAATYPLVRSSELGLSLFATHDRKELIDRSVVGETGNREVSSTYLGFSGSATHQLFGRNGTTIFGASFVAGDSDQRNALARAVDDVTRRANGGFTKLAYNVANLGPLGGDWGYFVSLRGQMAGKNLDSTEQISLGGTSGVRAYPIGEATGDEGWLLNVNLRRPFGNSMLATLFYDAGGITRNKTTWANWNAGNPNLPNRYTLSGVGAALEWRVTSAMLLSAILAMPIGDNPGRDANGNNSDGRPNRAHLWLSLGAQF